jgi:hypothetical protein
MEMNLESIKKFVNERVESVDFLKLLNEAEPDDDMPEDDMPEDLGGEDLDDGPDAFEGPDRTDVDMDSHSSGDGGDTDSTKEPEETDDKYADREDDPDFSGLSQSEGSAAEDLPSGEVIYDIDGVLQGINSTVSSSDIDLSEIDKAKTILEIVANGKKLKGEDFEDIRDPQSFSDIVNRVLFQVDDKTQNYFKMKIKSAAISFQNQKKIEASENDGEAKALSDLASKI